MLYARNNCEVTYENEGEDRGTPDPRSVIHGVLDSTRAGDVRAELPLVLRPGEVCRVKLLHFHRLLLSFRLRGIWGRG